MSNSNIGKTGIESIRIGGRTLDKLPIAELAITKQQWPNILEAHTQQEVKNILAEYPSQKISYLEARIKECSENIDRINQLKADQSQMISDYSGQISLCQYRDKEIANIQQSKESEESKKRAIKELKRKYPMYDVEEMRKQIEQCKEAIVRSDEVIKQEYDSIAELKEVITKCRLRDEKLKPYGVEVG